MLRPALFGGLTIVLAASLAGGGGAPRPPATRPAGESRLAPYAADADHPWNRLHRALFAREAKDGSGTHAHDVEPFLYRGSTLLLEGQRHREALAALDRFVAEGQARLIEDPARRLFLQRDLWAAFDHVAWYPDDWVFKSKHEPAVVALRGRLAKAIAALALGREQIEALPDNYAAAARSGRFAAVHDPRHPGRAFLPTDLFEAAGPWVRFHDVDPSPMAREHFASAGGRAAHAIFLRLPAGRAATERYLAELTPAHRPPLPAGSMVAMVRRALAIDRDGKLRLTPVTEMVQVRVYRDDAGAQDVVELTLDRAALFAGGDGLRATAADEAYEPFDRIMSDPFAQADGARGALGRGWPALSVCLNCHNGPGPASVTSIDRALDMPRLATRELLRTFAWEAEAGMTIKAKAQSREWGLLQGLMEAERGRAAAP